MNKSAALEKLTKLESEAAELRKIIEQPEEVGLWEPATGFEYWYVSYTGSVGSFTFKGDHIDLGLIPHGVCFKSASIARKASQLQRVHNHVMRAAFQADPDAGEWSNGRRLAVLMVDGQWEWMERGISTNHICVHTTKQAIEACRLLNAWQAKEDAK
jgi:hypothetical protein